MMNISSQAGWSWIISSENTDCSFPENDFETLSGFIIHQHETIPKLKECIIIGHYEFEVLNVSDTRLKWYALKSSKFNAFLAGSITTD